MSYGAGASLAGACESHADPPATNPHTGFIDRSTHSQRPTIRTLFALCAVALAARFWPPAASSPAELRAAAAAEPNPPAWPSSVLVFAPGDEDAQARIDAVYARNGNSTPADHAQFSDARFALLFKPGAYAVSVPVGYYTQVLGLGKTPRDVVFEAPGKGVYCAEAARNYTTGALDTFWRGVENVHVAASADLKWWKSGDGASKGMLWAASQAAPLRRLLVDGDLLLAQ
jgi:hypothetical protein